ncbi:MAG: EamA family transporter [Candidatus Magasanikbacteria bacterium]|nr:EamA family transporter [Candidatus Magasanikbacteria bacterium]
MFWFVLAIGGAAFDALYYILFKKFLRDIDQSVLFGGVSLISAVILFGASSAKGVPPIGANFYSAVLIMGILNTVAAILYLHALKISDVSLIIPFLFFTPRVSCGYLVYFFERSSHSVARGWCFFDCVWLIFDVSLKENELERYRKLNFC